MTRIPYSLICHSFRILLSAAAELSLDLEKSYKFHSFYCFDVGVIVVNDQAVLFMVSSID